MENLRATELDSPLNRRVRTFIGIGPPPEEWLEALDEWLVPLKRRLSEKVRWTRVERLHLTLRFFGNVSLEDLLEIKSRLKAMSEAFGRLSLSTSNLLLFPSEHKPRILALDLWDESRQVDQLEGEIRRGLAEFGQPPDDRPFRPHLTLARLQSVFRADREIILDVWEEGGGPKLPPWEARELTLFESKLQPGGSVYAPLAVFPFARRDL